MPQMTKEKINNIKEPLAISPRQIVFCFMSVFSLALIVRNSDVAIKYMYDGLFLCVRTVIPSLFPFMVISDMLVRSGAVTLVSKVLALPMKALFGVSGEGGCAVLLGTLCGFPIGAKCAVAMYDKGSISKEELERLLTFSNNPSSAFIISAVGVSLFGSRELGVKLYIMTLLSALIVGLAQNVIFRIKEKKGSRPNCDSAPTNINHSEKHKFGIEDFTESVGSSALSLLKICAFVVFFTAFLGTLSSAAEALSISQGLRAFIFGFFELTGGMVQASAVTPTQAGIALAAFISGWSGISVHLQIMSICADRDISFKPYFGAKLCQAILCSALFLII